MAEDEKFFGVSFTKPYYMASDGQVFTGMLDAYDYETKKILEEYEADFGSFVSGATACAAEISGRFEDDHDTGNVHVAFRAALQLAKAMGSKILPYKNTLIAGMSGRISKNNL